MTFPLRAGVVYLVIGACGAFLAPPSFAAGASEARESARLSNCVPKKVEVVQQTIGAEGKTIYRVSCTMPKTKDDAAANGPDALLIQCDGTLCETLRPVSGETK